MRAAATERAFEYWLVRYRATWRASLITSVLSPVLFLTAIGVGLGGYVHGGTGRVDGVRYAVFLAPGLLAATAMQTAVGEATWPVLGAIKWQKSYVAMLATPLTVADVFVGHLLFIAVRLLTVSAVFTAVMAAFGLAQSVGGTLLALVGAALTGLAFAAPIAAYSATQQRDSGFSLLYRLAMIPLFLFSGTFFPVSQLPAAIRPIAWVTPLWHGVTFCRDVSVGRGSAAALALHLGYLVALLAAGVVLGLRSYRRRLRW